MPTEHLLPHPDILFWSGVAAIVVGLAMFGVSEWRVRGRDTLPGPGVPCGVILLGAGTALLGAVLGFTP